MVERHEKVCTLLPPPLLSPSAAHRLSVVSLSRFFREGTKGHALRYVTRESRYAHITHQPVNDHELKRAGYVTESRATCKVVKSRDETLSRDPLPRSSRYRVNPEEEGRGGCKSIEKWLG